MKNKIAIYYCKLFNNNNVLKCLHLYNININKEIKKIYVAQINLQICVMFYLKILEKL